MLTIIIFIFTSFNMNEKKTGREVNVFFRFFVFVFFLLILNICDQQEEEVKNIYRYYYYYSLYLCMSEIRIKMR